MVSVITVNYNGLHDTCEMIESFKAHETYPYEMIVVDNNSRQSEGEEIKRRYPEVKIVQNANTGYAGGNNAGLKVAEGNYLFFINNDTVIKEPVLSSLVSRLGDKQNGGVSPMLKYSYAPDTIQYAGYTSLSPITLRNKMLGEHEQDNGQFSLPQETAYLHGAAMMIRLDVLQRIGTMSEIYFLFYEEIDWSIQMRRAGYKLWYEPAAVIYHKESMTVQRNSPSREFYLSRARMLFARKNISGIKKYITCTYICCIAAPKKALLYLLHGKAILAKATICGTLKGVRKKINDNPHLHH